MHISSNRVIESKNADFAVGDMVVANYGWQTHTVTDGKDVMAKLSKIDPTIPLSPSTALGVLGMPG